MLVVYGYQDCKPVESSAEVHWSKDRVVCIWHTRSDIFDPTSVENAVFRADGEPGKSTASGAANKFLFRHYVPYNRIFSAIEEQIIVEGMNRLQLWDWLHNLMAQLKIDPDEYLKLGGEPVDSRRNYDVWVDWAISSICQWHFNIFYGPGTGDGGGSKIDQPTGQINGAKQKARVEKAAAHLQANLKLLSLEKTVSIERKIFKMTKKEEEEDMALEKAEHEYLKDTADYVRKNGIWGHYKDTDSEDEDFDIDELRKFLGNK